MQPNPKADFYFRKNKQWQKEIETLRRIILECGLAEEVKWGVPTYTLQGNNVVLIHVFKHYCAILFGKGALLKDTEGILIQQTQNVQSARQIRFTSIGQIVEMESIVKAYVNEAIELEKSGAQVAFKKTSEFAMPEEFKTQLDELPELKAAFEALTPGRQRGYLLFFSAAKQSKTRSARVEKYMQHILDGKGLDDD